MPVTSSSFAELTSRGRGAISTIGLWGANAWEHLAVFLSVDPSCVLKPGEVRYLHWSSPSSTPSAMQGSEGVVVARPADDRWEIHCHGGRAAVGSIVRDLEQSGCEPSTPRAYRRDACKVGVLESLCDEVLSETRTELTAAIAMNQRKGVLRQAMEDLRDDLIAKRFESLTARLDSLLATANWGVHLTCPWRIVLAGRPNAGKSQLLNAIAGWDRAIVSPIAGTTRDALSVEVAIAGWPMVFHDTAGLRRTADPLEAMGIEATGQTIQDADLVVWVIDGTTGIEPNEGPFMAEQRRSLRVWNKCDLVPAPSGDVLPVSALTREGLEDFLNAVAERFVPEPTDLKGPALIGESLRAVIGEFRDHIQLGSHQAALRLIENLLGEPRLVSSSPCEEGI